MMFGVAFNHLHCREDAEDAVQDASLAILRQRQDPTNERGLAYITTDHASHALLDNRRVRARHHERMDPDADPRHHGTVPSAEQEALAIETARERVLAMLPQERECAAPRCSVRFEVGNGARRADARYCSDVCRVDAYRRERCR